MPWPRLSASLLSEAAWISRWDLRRGCVSPSRHNRASGTMAPFTSWQVDVKCEHRVSAHYTISGRPLTESRNYPLINCHANKTSRKGWSALGLRYARVIILLDMLAQNLWIGNRYSLWLHAQLKGKLYLWLGRFNTQDLVVSLMVACNGPYSQWLLVPVT